MIGWNGIYRMLDPIDNGGCNNGVLFHFGEW